MVFCFSGSASNAVITSTLSYLFFAANGPFVAESAEERGCGRSFVGSWHKRYGRAEEAVDDGRAEQTAQTVHRLHEDSSDRRQRKIGLVVCRFRQQPPHLNGQHGRTILTDQSALSD